MLQVIRTRNKKLMDVQSRFLSTTLQIWCYCGHVIKSRAMRHLNFVCQLNLSKSHKVWSSYLVSFRRSVEKFGWGGEKRPPPCEIGLTFKSYLLLKLLEILLLTLTQAKIGLPHPIPASRYPFSLEKLPLSFDSWVSFLTFFGIDNIKQA